MRGDRGWCGRCSATHDLRVPVTCIESFSGELRERWRSLTDDEREDLLTQIEEQAHQLDDLVTALLEYSSTERGQRSASIFPLPLREVVEAALEAVAPLVGGRPMEVRVPQVEVLADAVLLTRSLTHLLTNAIRYSPPGTPVTVEARVDPDWVRVDVIDQGSGLDAETAARAFEPFWRRRTEEEEEPPGLGLGLALTAEYVRAMGGTVGVESTPGEGSTFSFTLRRVK